MQRGRVVIALALALTGACAPLRRDTTVCAPYRKLRCVAGASCVWDRQRRCRVCQCDPLEPARAQPPVGYPVPARTTPDPTPAR